MMKLIADTLDRYARTQTATFTEDRSQTVGASEVGQCARKIFWLKNEGWAVDGGVERDVDYNDTWGARMRGTIFENNFWVPAMRKRFGTRLLLCGNSQRTFVKDFLSATPDAMIVRLTKAEKEAIGTDAAQVLVECKTTDPRTNLVEAKNENIFQTHVQMGLIRETTKYRPTHAIISYTDASFWSDIKEFMVTFDQQIYEAAHERATLMMTAKSAAETRARGLDRRRQGVSLLSVYATVRH